MKSSSLFFLLTQPKPIILISIRERFEQARAHTYGYRHGYQKGGEWILDYVTKKPLTAKAIVLRNAIKGHRATLLRSPDLVKVSGVFLFLKKGILIFSLLLWQIV